MAASRPFRETLASDYRLADPFDPRTYPAARRKRTGPPPSGQGAGFDPTATRGSPIRARNFAFGLGENSGRALLASPGFVGPGMVKRLDIWHTNMPSTVAPAHFNIWVNTTPYVTASNVPVGTIPAGVPIWEAGRAGDSSIAFTAEGGLVSYGPQINGHRVVIDHYVPDAQFFLALVLVNPVAAASFCTGSLLVYEGVIPLDFPAILG